MEFLIKDRKVGVDHPPLVIAEIGINHNGKIRIAHGTSVLSEDDIALVFAKPKAIEKLKKLFSA